MLKNEVAGIEERQLPLPDGSEQKPTLTAVLRQAFAAKTNCHVTEAASRMWEVLSGTIFDRVDDEMMASLVNDEPLKKGMRRMF